MSSHGKNMMSWRKRAVTLAGVKENTADVRLPFPISTKESKYFTHWVFFFFGQFHLIKKDKDDAEKWESLYQVRSGARENLPSDHDTAQAKGEVSKAPIKGDFHIHEHRRMCVLLRESSVRWCQRLWQLRNGWWGADCSAWGRWAEDVFLLQGDVGAVCPSPLVAYRAPNFFSKQFSMVVSETQVSLVHVFWVHLTMLSQNVCGKLLRQSMDRFPSGLIPGKLSGSSPCSEKH